MSEVFLSKSIIQDSGSQLVDITEEQRGNLKRIEYLEESKVSLTAEEYSILMHQAITDLILRTEYSINRIDDIAYLLIEGRYDETPSKIWSNGQFTVIK